MTNYNENFEHCKHIAEELEAIYYGEYKIIDGEFVEVQEDENGACYIEYHGRFFCDFAHERYGDDDTEDLEDLEDGTLWNYFNDVSDIEYTVNARKEYVAVRLLVAYGGPNIYIDTKSGYVELYWWTETARYPIDRDVINEIDSIFEDYFNCI